MTSDQGQDVQPAPIIRNETPRRHRIADGAILLEDWELSGGVLGVDGERGSARGVLLLLRGQTRDRQVVQHEVLLTPPDAVALALGLGQMIAEGE